jgi:hypothetical protein
LQQLAGMNKPARWAIAVGLLLSLGIAAGTFSEALKAKPRLHASRVTVPRVTGVLAAATGPSLTLGAGNLAAMAEAPETPVTQPRALASGSFPTLSVAERARRLARLVYPDARVLPPLPGPSIEVAKTELRGPLLAVREAAPARNGGTHAKTAGRLGAGARTPLQSGPWISR